MNKEQSRISDTHDRTASEPHNFESNTSHFQSSMNTEQQSLIARVEQTQLKTAYLLSQVQRTDPIVETRIAKQMKDAKMHGLNIATRADAEHRYKDNGEELEVEGVKRDDDAMEKAFRDKDMASSGSETARI